MSNTNILPSTKFKNNIRIVSGAYIVMDSDVILLCDTSIAPVTIELALIPADYFSTQYKLYIVDNSNNASTNNITINAPTGYTINGEPNYIIKENGQSIQIFISSNTNYGIANAVNSPVTSQISDEPFGISWDGVTDMGASKNALYDEIISIGSGFGNTAFVRKGGNDETAQVGNILKAFKTISAAIYGYVNSSGVNIGNGLMGALTNPSLPFNQITNPYTGTGAGFSFGSALDIDAGVYEIGDVGSGYEECPQGLKPQGSKFDIQLSAGCTIKSYCSYGIFCVQTSEGTYGNIFGDGTIENHAIICTKSIDGVNNFPFNISFGFKFGIGRTQIVININSITNENENSTTSLFRCGFSNNGNNGNIIVYLKSRMFSRSHGGPSNGVNQVTMLCDTDSNCSINLPFSQAVGLDSFSEVNGQNYSLKIKNPFKVTLNNFNITARGAAFGSNNNRCIEIDNVSNGVILFNNMFITAINTSSKPNYKLIDFIGYPPPVMGTSTMSNLTFNNCRLYSSDRISFTPNGFSFYVDGTNLAFKIIDTYSQMPSGGSGSVVNLITSAGNGFQTDINL